MQQQQITQLVHTFLKVFRCLYKLVGILLTVSLEHIYISMNNIICVSLNYSINHINWQHFIFRDMTILIFKNSPDLSLHFNEGAHLLIFT